MKSFTFWIMIILELAYCGGAIGSILALEIEAYKGSHILECGIAIALCSMCGLLSWIYCRIKKIDNSKFKSHMRTGIVVSFGIVSALMVLTYIAIERWGGFFL